jgi:hypothetical protein
MKKFLKALGKGAEDFLYLRIKFPNRGDNKFKQDIFFDSQIRNIMFYYIKTLYVHIEHTRCSY